MIFTVLFQSFFQWIISIVFLIPLSLIFSICSLFSSGNAIKNPKAIFITGASSGIGMGLAIEYSKPGVVIGITGRSAERLSEVKRMCEAKGAIVKVFEVDVVNRLLMASIIDKFDQEFDLDIVIANAGVSSGTVGVDDLEQYYSIMDTNVNGVLNTVLPVIDTFKKRRKGQIVVMGSIASRIGALGDAGPYCASKIAVESFASTWRAHLKPFGVGVSLVAPGFVKTPMTDKNDFYMPLMYSIKEASEIMVQGISRDYALITFPTSLYTAAWMIDVFPINLVSLFIGNSRPSKPAVASTRENSETTLLSSKKQIAQEI
jgi:NADP-dependent 3-hydroxy acid dehydrogenase YdfG